MITRIVKMEFLEGREQAFLEIFEEVQLHIKGFEGCHSLELLHGIGESSTFFTVSQWESERALENYRNSSLFADTWARTKSLFSQRASAWTLESVVRLA